MVINGKSGFATATVFLILIIITASLAAILKRENFYFTSLSSVIGHRYQLDFKRGIEEKILKGKDLIGRNEIYKVKKINKTFPAYILENKKILKDWII